MHVLLIFSSFSYQFSRKSIPLISCENVTNPLVSDILRWGWHVQKVSVCPEEVPESSWKHHKSKDLEFLHRSCTLKKFSTLKKNIKKNIKKMQILKSDFCWTFFLELSKIEKVEIFNQNHDFQILTPDFGKSQDFSRKNFRCRIFFSSEVRFFFCEGIVSLTIYKHAMHEIRHFWI